VKRRWTYVILSALVCCTVARGNDESKPSTVKKPGLRLELLGRVKADQEARTTLVAFLKKSGGGVVDPSILPADRKAEYEKLGAAVKKADQENTKRLSDIIDEHGWPANSLVGRDGSHAAWLLVQHADADLKLQRKCLDLMAKLPKAEVSQTDLAYLTDRVLLAEGKKQIYGTQFTSSGGKWEPRPLEDAANVDKRRAKVGLQPLAEYVGDLESLYGSPSKK
jgi:uncharacterized protein DUF6624